MVIPTFKDWGEQGENGKEKLNRVTRYITIVISMVQALLIIFSLGSKPENVLGNSLIQYQNAYWVFYIYMAVVITAGSAFTMWLADLITRHGIGNGSSIIIAAGIISSIPRMFTTLNTKYRKVLGKLTVDGVAGTKTKQMIVKAVQYEINKQYSNKKSIGYER